MTWLVIAVIALCGLAILAAGIGIAVYNRLSLRRDLCLESRRQLQRCWDERAGLAGALGADAGRDGDGELQEIRSLLNQAAAAPGPEARSRVEAELGTALAAPGLQQRAGELGADEHLLGRLQDLQRSATALVRLHNRHVESYARLRANPVALPLRWRFPRLARFPRPVLPEPVEEWPGQDVSESYDGAA